MTTTSLRPSETPDLVRRRSLLGFRAACELMWGERGIQEIRETLPADVRERTSGMRPLPEWVPVGDLIAWHVAVRGGPGREPAVFTQHVHRTIDQGFGRVKRLMLSLATPHLLAQRAADLWSDEYSTGALVSEPVDKRSVRLRLRRHPYVRHELMQQVMPEVYRYITSLTQATNVSVTHVARPGELVIALRWD